MTPRDKYLRQTYQLTERAYKQMVRAQGGKCPICFKRPKPGKHLDVDHDHRTGRVRGALCNYCNRRVLGRLRNPELLRRAAAYLESNFDGRALDAAGGFVPSLKLTTTAEGDVP